jgi:16S rRNA A1518/A1519 N6-dimethyltransferase RsmA/KsgA/DIM1 with predicted DNA glycosylase/AP lyase activity
MPKVPSRRRKAAPPRVATGKPGVAQRHITELAHSQNFISDSTLVRRLLGYVELDGADTIVEIGPGKGALTVGLLQLATRVLAVEADPALAIALINRFRAEPRLTIAHGDFLDFPLPARPFIVAANIPFNRTAEIVRKLTGEPSGLRAAYLIMQREAAAKYSGQPQGPYSLLSHFIQLEFTVRTLCQIPRACFSPQPRVDAAFALFRKRKIPILAGGQAQLFHDLLSYLHPRGPLLKGAGIDGRPRPATRATPARSGIRRLAGNQPGVFRARFVCRAAKDRRGSHPAGSGAGCTRQAAPHFS